MATTDSQDLIPRMFSPGAQPIPAHNDHGARVAKEDRPISQTYWAAEQESVATSIELPDRRKLLHKYGDFSLAYSTLVQPRLMYFSGNDQSSNSVGYIAYRSRWGFRFALGDPVVDQVHRREFLEQFIAKYQKPTFCQISEPTANILDSMGYQVNEMGVDTILDLESYDFAGKEKEWLRYAANWTAKREFEIREMPFERLNENCIETISEAWRETRTIKRKEIRFINRPIVLADEPDVRKFYLFDPGGQPLAFVFFDPLYRDGAVFGYVTAIKRRHPDAPLYAEHAIMKHAIEKLKEEGVQQIRLGLSPGAWIEDDRFRANRLTSWIYRAGFESTTVNRLFYGLQGHAQYKRRFRGREEKTYLASPARFDLPRQVALIGLCGFA